MSPLEKLKPRISLRGFFIVLWFSPHSHPYIRRNQRREQPGREGRNGTFVVNGGNPLLLPMEKPNDD
jgi:hypothetical protein